MTTASVFVGVSLDGFIARRDGALDWLESADKDVGPHGYEEFIATIDTIVIGRKTFETVMSFDGWFYGDRRVVALSSRPVDRSGAVARGGNVEQMSGTPAEIMLRLAASGASHVYVDGGITIQQFLRAGLIDRMVITRLPVLIGEGIPLFGPLPHDIRLRHVTTRTLGGGAVQSEYDVLR
jgi:dihydrofolate reductase